jgi:hypothetical protein
MTVYGESDLVEQPKIPFPEFVAQHWCGTVQQKKWSTTEYDRLILP